MKVKDPVKEQIIRKYNEIRAITLFLSNKGYTMDRIIAIIEKSYFIKDKMIRGVIQNGKKDLYIVKDPSLQYESIVNLHEIEVNKNDHHLKVKFSDFELKLNI